MPEESKLAEKLENSNKFTEEELKTVKEIQQSYISLQTQFGQLTIARKRVADQFEALDKNEVELNNNYSELQKKESAFLDEVTKKYGEGSLNPETGVFTKNKSE